MILLTSTSDLLRIVTGETCDVDVHASFMDLNAGNVTPGRTNTNITTATTTTVVASPGSSTQRNVKTLTIRNAHASTSVTVTLIHTDGTTAVELVKRVLAAGESLIYVDGLGFSAADGGFFPSSGAVLDLADNASPGSPSSGFVRLFGRNVAGRIYPAFVGPNGQDTAVQSHIFRNSIGWWCPPGNATTVPGVIGLSALTATGTATARNVATTNLFTQTRRIGYVSAATAGQSCGVRLAVTQFWRGNATNFGGFTFHCRFGVSDASTVANARMFVGMCAATTALANAEVSSNANIIGVGCDAGDTTLRIYHNDGAGTATEIDLGASFPSQTLSADLYEVTIFCPPNASFVTVEVTNLSTDASDRRTLTTDLPASNQLLAFQAWRNNGATAAAVGLDIVNIGIETDY